MTINQLNHTPGPWVVAMAAEIDGELMPDGSGGMSYTGRDIYDRRLGVVTETEWLTQEEGEPESLARPYSFADARLIASSPDLLAACVAMLGTWGSDDEDAIIAARDAARDAISKATGIQP